MTKGFGLGFGFGLWTLTYMGKGAVAKYLIDVEVCMAALGLFLVECRVKVYLQRDAITAKEVQNGAGNDEVLFPFLSATVSLFP
jgi:hypothetical protein